LGGLVERESGKGKGNASGAVEKGTQGGREEDIADAAAGLIP